MLTTWPVASHASFAEGRKYAKVPAIADSAIANTARTAVRVILRRLREALARRPGRIPITGKQSSERVRAVTEHQSKRDAVVMLPVSRCPRSSGLPPY